MGRAAPLKSSPLQALALSIAGLGLSCALGLKRRAGAIAPALGLSSTVLVAVHSLADFSLQIPAVAATYALIMGVATVRSLDRTPRPPPVPG